MAKKKIPDHYVYPKPIKGEEDLIPEFIVLVGLAGSGKSTYANNLVKNKTDKNGKPYVIISSDMIRVELFNNIDNQEYNEEVFSLVHRRIKENLRVKNSVILDATNLKLKNRKAYLNVTKKIKCVKKAIIFATPLDQCVLAQRNREHKVPEEKIKKQRMSFEIPFFEEGWNEIDIVDTSGHSIISNIKPIETTKNTIYYQRQVGFDQKTKHHKYTLDEHSSRVAEAIKNYSIPYSLIQNYTTECINEKAIEDYFEYTKVLLEEVAYVHDYGKLFVGIPKEDGSGDYKYFNHHNVSAYELMCGVRNLGLSQITYIIDFLFYVNYHMQPFFISTPKAEKKWREIFGDWRYDCLTIFNKCDIIGSGTRLERVGVN